MRFLQEKNSRKTHLWCWNRLWSDFSSWHLLLHAIDQLRLPSLPACDLQDPSGRFSFLVDFSSLSKHFRLNLGQTLTQSNTKLIRIEKLSQLNSRNEKQFLDFFFLEFSLEFSLIFLSIFFWGDDVSHSEVQPRVTSHEIYSKVKGDFDLKSWGVAKPTIVPRKGFFCFCLHRFIYILRAVNFSSINLNYCLWKDLLKQDKLVLKDS